MNTLLIFGIIIYCIIAAIFMWGMNEEYKKDTEPLDVSPEFMKTSIFLCSAFWPLLILIAFIKACQK